MKAMIYLILALILISAVCVACSAPKPNEESVTEQPAPTNEQAPPPDEQPILNNEQPAPPEEPPIPPIDPPAPPEEQPMPPTEQPEPPEELLAPGSTVEYTDPAAAKAIQSADVTSFEFYASLTTVVNDDHPELTEPHYEFSAVRDGDAVTVTRNGETLQKDAAFMTQLQTVIEKHDFAQYNGDYHQTYGLPDDFGATINVKYASGEKIYATNNQTMFLPLEVVADLVALFYE